MFNISLQSADIWNPEHVRALNMIDVAFAKSRNVRSLWHELYVMLNNAGLSDANGAALRQKKHYELITEMARVVGYKNTIAADTTRPD